VPKIGEGPLVGRLTTLGLTASQHILAVISEVLAGFLVVPGPLFSAVIDIFKVVGTSLISVGTSGMATAVIICQGGWRSLSQAHHTSSAGRLTATLALG